MRLEDIPPGNADVSLLRRVSRIVNSDLSMDEMLGQIVMLTAQVCGCDACIVYLLESASGDLVLRASQVPHPRMGDLRMQLGEGITGWVAQQQIAVALASKAFGDSRFKSVSGLVEDTYEAFLSVPVVTRGKSIGVINVHHHDPHTQTASRRHYRTCSLYTVESACQRGPFLLWRFAGSRVGSLLGCGCRDGPNRTCGRTYEEGGLSHVRHARRARVLPGNRLS